MKIESDLSGLKKLTNNAKALQGSGGVSLTEILNDSFIQSNTPFNDLNELFEKGGFKFETLEEFEAIPDEELNTFIASISEYSTFQDMIGAAGAALISSRLFKGL